MHSNPESQSELTKKLKRIEGHLLADPGNRDLLASAIDANLAVGRIDVARRRAEAATRHYPDDAYFQHRLGNVLLAQGNIAEAEAIFSSLYQGSANAKVGFSLAYVYYLQARYQDATEVLSPIVEQSERPVGAVTLLLRVYRRLGEIRRAIELIECNIAACKNDSDFLAVASLLYFDGGQIEKARQMSVAAQFGGARPLEALVVGGHIALAEGDVAAAGAQFRAALAICPEDGRSWAGLGLANMLKRDLPTAAGQLGRAVEYIPTHIGARHILGWCKILSHDLLAADEVFEQALALDHNFGESHGGLAIVHALRGNRLMAEGSVRRALDLDPKGFSAHYALMVLSGDIDDPAKLRESAFKTLSAPQGPFGKSLTEALANF